MPWTLTQYIDDQFGILANIGVGGLYQAGAGGFFTGNGWIIDWVTDVENRYLQGVPHPGRAGFIQDFKDRVEARVTACLQNNTGTVGIVGMMDDTAQQYLDAGEAARIAAAPAPQPLLPHHQDYLDPGVVCTGTPVNAAGATVAPWPGRDAYSANHARANDFAYRQGGGGANLALAFVPTQASANMVAAAKPNMGMLFLLGDGRHAEDGWFSRWGGDFVQDVNAQVPQNPLPALAGRSLWEQAATTPRVEFLMSMSPCPANALDPQEGCQAYYAELRNALQIANIPIIIFYYRVWLANQQARGIQTVDANGAIVDYPNNWV